MQNVRIEIVCLREHSCRLLYASRRLPFVTSSNQFIDCGPIPTIKPTYESLLSEIG